jgi:hypothetical protein
MIPREARPATAKPGNGAGGRRLPRISFFRSIRFRLTAWYTLVLVLILVLLGVLLSTFLARALENEVDNRLASASTQIASQTTVRQAHEGASPVAAGGTWSDDIKVPETQEFQALLTSGLFYIVTDLDLQWLRTGGVVPISLDDTVDLSALTAGGVYRTVSSNDTRVRRYVKPVVVPRLSPRGEDPPRVVGAIVVG